MTAASLGAVRRAFPDYDEVLMWAVLALLAIGLVMVYSASIATAEGSKFTGFRPSYYQMRHGLFIFIGVVAGVFAFQVKVETWQKLAPYLFLLGVVLLDLVLIPGIGRAVNGSRRWLSLFVFNMSRSDSVPRSLSPDTATTTSSR